MISDAYVCEISRVVALSVVTCACAAAATSIGCVDGLV